MHWLTQQRGFTLLEVMLALGILGFVGVSFLAAMAVMALLIPFLVTGIRQFVLATDRSKTLITGSTQIATGAMILSRDIRKGQDRVIERMTGAARLRPCESGAFHPYITLLGE